LAFNIQAFARIENPSKSPLKFWRQGGVSRNCPNFLGTP